MKNCEKISDYINNDNLDLEKIINNYSTYINTIINNMSKNILNNEDKEEIASEVFFSLWKNKDRLEIDKFLSPYIAGITKNIVRNYLRKIKINLDISNYENNLYSYDDVNFFENNIEEISKIERKLETMKEIDKKIFLAFYYSSKSIKDIAREQKLSEFSVKQRLYRIRKKLKEVK